jgi:imidazolonepropionase-like amidohydrolase
MLRNPLASRLATAALAGFVLCAPVTAVAQRAAAFGKDARAYVTIDAPGIRIDDVRIVDGTGAPARNGQSLLIRDGRIARIGPVAELASEAADVVIEGRGRTVMPGLVMLHEHLLFLDPLTVTVAPAYTSEASAAPKAYLAFGVTTIRTAGTFAGTDDLQVARKIREGEFVGPEIHVTAPFLEGAGSFAFQMRPIADTAAARRIVRFWADEGATWFKIYMNVTRDVLAAAIDEAHARGLRVTGHLCSVTFHEAVAAGIDNLEHGVIVATDFVADKRPDKCPNTNEAMDAVVALAPSGPEMTELIATLVRRNVAITSTLAVFGAGLVDWFPTTDDLRFLNDQSQLWALRYLGTLSRAPERRALGMRRLKAEMEFERAFVAAGGTLLVGTDPTGWGGTVPGPGNHAALRFLVEAGFSPLDAIRMATSGGAKFLRVDDRVGTLAPGLQADLLVVDGRPDADIKELGRIDVVFRNGIAYDPKQLQDAVRGKIGR